MSSNHGFTISICIWCHSHFCLLSHYVPFRSVVDGPKKKRILVPNDDDEDGDAAPPPRRRRTISRKDDSGAVADLKPKFRRSSIVRQRLPHTQYSRGLRLFPSSPRRVVGFRPCSTTIQYLLESRITATANSERNPNKSSAASSKTRAASLSWSLSLSWSSSLSSSL